LTAIRGQRDDDRAEGEGEQDEGESENEGDHDGQPVADQRQEVAILGWQAAHQNSVRGIAEGLRHILLTESVDRRRGLFAAPLGVQRHGDDHETPAVLDGRALAPGPPKEDFERSRS
jgi:hypothetical protein